MIDTIQLTLSDMQALERDVNFGIADIFNLDLGVTQAVVEQAYQLLTAYLVWAAALFATWLAGIQEDQFDLTALCGEETPELTARLQLV